MMKNTDAAELRMETARLYREEVFTDRRTGSVRVLTPVTADGLADATRKVLYVGEAQILTPGGVLPLVFEIDANSLREAIHKFASAAEAAVEHAVKELEALRREAASSIIVPSSGMIQRPQVKGLGWVAVGVVKRGLSHEKGLTFEVVAPAPADAEARVRSEIEAYFA